MIKACLKPLVKSVSARLLFFNFIFKGCGFSVGLASLMFKGLYGEVEVFVYKLRLFVVGFLS